MIISFSSQSANGRSSDRENSITDHQDTTNYRVHPNDRNLRKNRTGDHLWDQSSSSRNPNGISGVGRNDNRMLIGNPNGNSQSEREASGNNLHSTGTASTRHHAIDNPMLVNPTSGMRVTNYSNHRQATSINRSSENDCQTNGIDDNNTTGVVSVKHHTTDNPTSVNPIRETITDDFSICLTNRDTNDFARRIEAAADSIPYESLTRRRHLKCQFTIPLNRHIKYMDPESVLSTSSSGSDSVSVAEPHPKVIDLSDPGGWNSHRESQASSFWTRNEDWNHNPYSYLPLLPMDKTNLSEEFLTTITCRLTLEPFTDTVVGDDGHTYKRG